MARHGDPDGHCNEFRRPRAHGTVRRQREGNRNVNLWRGLMNACGLLAGLLVGALTVLVCYDVIARNVGLPSVPWIVEVAEYMLPVGTCLAAPWLMYQNQHVRLDVLNMVLPSGALRVLDRAACVIGALVSAVVTWYAVAAIADSRAAGTITMKALSFPEWWLLAPLPVGFGLLAVECVRRLFVPPVIDATPAELASAEDAAGDAARGGAPGSAR